MLSPGSSRQKPEESLPCRKNHEQVVPPISFSRVLLPSHPSTGSESESVYSCQGYETALCLNSEYVENEEECGEDIEDASESGKDLKHLDDDASSVMENVGAAVLALHALCGSEREFWPDDNDTDESTDEDPELVADHWKCLTCDEKNKPFVRYCSKCWQLRKNWLPERPKRRKRRKPRPKNKHKKHQTNAIPKWENYPIQSPLDPSAYSDLLKENTIPSTSFSMDCCRSQDSGIFLSQDNLTDFSQKLKREDSQSSNLGNNLTDFLPENLGSVSHQDIHEILNKKSACFMVTRESSAAPQAFDGESKDQENEINNFFKFLLSKAGKEWLNSAAGRCFLASPEVKEVIRRRLRHSSAASEVSQSTNLVSVLCSVCHVRPKNALIIHGRVAHLVACYQCAHHLLERGSRCPACRRKIHMVCKQM
ncbi:hypothetical protein OTU49_016235 [Cherax quadricarinatus]|uniref:RanBP2-type domain-containing protein n=1 Tax=Cherax quadricarinatus TaxID=27406 RepID=A0AAW0Y7G4_CHEQU